MNTNPRTIKSSHLTLALGTLALCVALVPSARAASRNADSNGDSANVVAHVPLSGPAAAQMILRRQGDRQYLYVDQGPEQGVTIVDVTRPSRARVVSHVGWPDGTRIDQLRSLGHGLALSESPQAKTASLRATPENLNVLDLRDPAHPHVLKSFQGVTSVLPDTSRNLIFVANKDGVWIVRHQMTQSAYAGRHMCTSEDWITPLPDCY